jgi:hypothetical protein
MSYLFILFQHKKIPDLKISGNKIVNNEAGRNFSIISRVFKAFVCRK